MLVFSQLISLTPQEAAQADSRMTTTLRQPDRLPGMKRPQEVPLGCDAKQLRFMEFAIFCAIIRLKLQAIFNGL